MVVPIRGHDEEAEIVLRHAAARVKWAGGGRFKKVVCLDCGMDDETKKSAIRFAVIMISWR